MIIVPLSLGAQFAFWMLMPVMILGALGTILAKKPVHSALSLAAVMLSLAVQYAAQQAPFLFAVQIIVYTGAILMLFLFVMMIVGVDTSESLIETIKGQRLLAILAGVGFFVLLLFAIGNALVGSPTGLSQPNAAHGGNVQGLASLIFGRYVIAFEATSALLITAALGAMVLAHRERLTKKQTQADMVATRIKKFGETGAHPGAMPPPGVYARHNAVDTPALLAGGEVAETSVSTTLRARGVIQNPVDLIAPTQATVRAIAPDRADNPATAVASFVEHGRPGRAKGPEPVEKGPEPVEKGPEPVEKGPEPVEKGPEPVEGQESEGRSTALRQAQGSERRQAQGSERRPAQGSEQEGEQ